MEYVNLDKVLSVLYWEIKRRYLFPGGSYSLVQAVGSEDL